MQASFAGSGSQVNQVSVTGGGAANISATDSTVVAPYASLLVGLIDSGNFTQAENNATYTINISNQAGGAQETGTVSISESLPTGLTLVSIGGTGWTCFNGDYCSSSDSLAAGASYPPVVVTVNIAANTPSSIVNAITVLSSSQRITASDTTVVLPHAAAVIIQASTAGAPFSLEDGSSYQAPMTFYWPGGVQHAIIWLTAIPGQANARYAFLGWSDGIQSNPRTIAGGVVTTYSANISAQYQLVVSVSPLAEGTVTVNPSSVDGFYNAGQTVTLTATANAGFEFSGFTPAFNSGSTFSMNSPKTGGGQFLLPEYFLWAATQRWRPWPCRRSPALDLGRWLPDNSRQQFSVVD